jgi:thioredoxin 1
MQTALVITGIIIIAIGLLFFIVRTRMKNIPLVADHDKILTLTDKNFQHQTKNKVILVDFWASWCAPCRMMAPVLNEVAGELSDNSYVGKVNIEQYQSMAQQYKIRSIPTIVLLKNGKEVDRFVGIKSKEFLVNQINSTLAD